MWHARRLVVAVVVVLLAAGCTSTSGESSDKAGAVPAGKSVVLQMASTSWDLADVPPLEWFARRVAALSSGNVQIDVTNNYGNYAPDAEADLLHAVASGDIDLGWAGSRVFDTVGVPTFAPLSAPMLIDSYGLVDAVLRSNLTHEMLTGLSAIGVTGLALLGDELRLPIGVQHPLRAPADWRGLSIGTFRSDTQAAAIRALGAEPVEAFGPYRSRDVQDGTIQGFELDVRRYVVQKWGRNAPYVTANVVLWPQFDVLFANPDTLSSLTAQQRDWLAQAARDAALHSVGTARDREQFVRQACVSGAHFVTATKADLRALRAAFAPVYRAIGRSRQQSTMLHEIEALKATTPHDSGLGIPRGCG